MSKAISSLAVGDKIEVPVLSAYQSRFGAKIVFKVADKNHSGYPSNSVTLITEKIIQLMCSDAKEPNNSDSNRRNYGNNRHIYSNILQWLNSNATAGSWYSAKHSADAPPTNANVDDNYNEYDAWAGFLAMLDPKFVAELLDTTLTVVKSSADGGSYETFTAKMFLASTTEVGLANEDNIAEGELLALFSNDASRVAYPTAECVSNSEYTNSSLTTSKGWYWWLRTPYSSDASSVRFVYSGGALLSLNAFYGSGGVRPLCNLQSSILVSDSPNASGNYEIIYNQPPEITGTDGDIGTFGETSPTYVYTVTDPQGGTVSVTEALDGETLRTYTVTLGQENTLTIPAETYLATLNGTHTLTITATDSVGASTTRTMTFTKNVTSCAFTQTESFPADDRPTRCVVNIQGSFPKGSTPKVEICNNGNDATPTWEDITQSALYSQKYFFKNETKTAESWGVKIKASLERGTSDGECYISSLGGVFQ